MLIAVDYLWWEVREQLDAYMNVADDEMDSYQDVLSAFLQFVHCMHPQSRLLQAHMRSQHARYQARRHGSRS